MKEKKDESSFGKRLKNEEDDFELEPISEEELDFPEGEDNDGWEEEEEPDKPWVTLLTFLGLAVLAAIICAILWHFTHPDKSGENDGSAVIQTSETPESGDDLAENSGDGQEEISGEGEEGSWLEVIPEDEEDNIGQGTGQDAEAPGQGTGQDAEAPGQGTDAGTPGQGTGQDAGAPGQDADGAVQEPTQGTTAMTFTEGQESVTPKDVVNLRSVPTTADEGNIVVQIQNGEVLTRTGINQNTGWSRVEYGEQTLYAVSQYLTTDLDYKPPVQASNPNRVSTISGRIIIFSDCDDWITPKEYVNLRTEPSTTEGDSTVSCQLNHGEKAHRTGFSVDSGWSRVEYNGKVLYVVTSLMNVTDGE